MMGWVGRDRYRMVAMYSAADLEEVWIEWPEALAALEGVV